MQPKIQPDAPDSPLDQDASCLKISDDGHFYYDFVIMAPIVMHFLQDFSPSS